MSPEHYLALSAILFTIGALGVLVRRNALVVFMCIELMLNATNLAFISFSRMHGNLDGQIIAFFVMVVAAAEVVIGLAIIMTVFRTRRASSVDDANLLKYWEDWDESGRHPGRVLAPHRAPARGRRHPPDRRQAHRPVGTPARRGHVGGVVRGRRRDVRPDA